MADYYPLISRAVAGLEKNNGENRRALYERARAALLAQLRGVTPALNESDITRERLALEESIRKVEAEAARQFVEPSRQPPPPKIRPAEPRRAEERRWEEVEPSAPPPRRYVNPPSQVAQENPPAARQDTARRLRPSQPILPDARQSDSIFDRPLPSESQPQPPTAPPPMSPPQASPPLQRHPLRRPAPERRPPSDTGLKDFRNVISEANELGGASARAEKSAREAYAAVPPTDLDRPPRSFDRSQYDRSEPRMFDPQAQRERMFEPPPEEEARPHEDFSEPMLESSFVLDDARPAPSKGRRGPPPPVEEEVEFEEPEAPIAPRRSYRDLIKGLIAAGAIIAVGGLLLWQWRNMVALYRSFRAAPTEVAREPSPTTGPKKSQERIEPGSA
jgi:hypothetical protein